MKVHVGRSGGLLGRRVEWTVVIDEQPDAEQWHLLVSELPWNEPAATNTAPDRYTYEIRCAPHEITIGEQQLTGVWRQLVDRVRDVSSKPSNRPAASSQPTDNEPKGNEPTGSNPS
ncbi:MAG: protealysin inhibitor emfourin [Rhodoglobus sp.]